MAQGSLFGTSGIRGDTQAVLTTQFCVDIARTFIEFLKKHNLLSPLAVGMDPRESSPRIKKDLFLGLGTAAVPLFDEGVTPIPSVNWLIKNTEVKAGIMITGSHIAAELNGLKFYAHDEEISVEDQIEIETIYRSLTPASLEALKSPEVKVETRAKDLYARMLKGLIKTELPGWKVAVDCANGSQSVVMPQLLRELGLETIEVNCQIGKDFIARDTDTDDKAGIEELKKTVVAQGCDFGIAFDGDGDRVVFVDEKGNFVPGEYSCSLIAKDAPGDKIVTTFSASQVIDHIGKEVYRTKVGSPFVVGKMKETGATFGFESNGGAVSAEIMYTRDGGGMIMKMLGRYARAGKSFSEMIAELPKYYMFRTKVDYEWELKDIILARAKEKFSGIKTEDLDGLKIWQDENTWILFRSSANAPEFRVFAESRQEAKAKQLLESGISFVESIIKEHAQS